MSDDLDPDFRSIADEARRVEPRVGRASTHTSAEYKMVRIIETAGLTTQEVGRLSDALNAFRRRRNLAAEFLIVNGTGDGFVKPLDVPSGWPPR